jgi:hypothetical protein
MQLAATFVIAGFLGMSAVAGAQTTVQSKPSAPADATAPTNAELQKEVESLREQVRQLQEAQKASPAQKHSAADGQGDKTKSGTGMGKKGMQKGMGMMDMDKSMEPKDDMDDSKEMPPPDADKPDSMGHM